MKRQGSIHPIYPNSRPISQRSQDLFPPRCGNSGSATWQPMTTERLDELIGAIGDGITGGPETGIWEFTVVDTPVSVIADEANDRMRIVVPIAYAEEVPPEILFRALQANFDTALDSRYAIAQGVIWATFIHPLSPLTDEQFLSGTGQTVNLARTFGTTYNSGALTFGGGDSMGLIERDLIEELLRRGEEI